MHEMHEKKEDQNTYQMFGARSRPKITWYEDLIESEEFGSRERERERERESSIEKESEK